MPSALIQDFALSLPLDNNLLHADVISGDGPDQAEVLSLAAASQALFVTACHESRSIDSVDKCYRLWADVARLFEELCSSWADVNSQDSQIRWLLARLRRYRDLAQDHIEIYTVTTAERLSYVENKADLDFESYGQRNGSTPAGYVNRPNPAHVYSTSKSF